MLKIVKTTDIEHRKKIENALKNNGGYCPCALLKTSDYKCMCKAFREKIDKQELGFCHCGLYEIKK